MTLRECEERLEEIDKLEQDIILDGYGYLDGKKYSSEDTEKIKKLREYIEAKREKLIQPLTIEDCKRMIALCVEAEEQVLGGQQYEFEGRKLTRANLREIRDLKEYYQKEQYRLETGTKRGIKMYRVFPNNK